MNAQDFTYAFLAAAALKQPFPAVMETGSLGLGPDVTGSLGLGPDVDRAVAKAYAEGQSERRRTVYAFGLGFAVLGGALVAMYEFSPRKARR